MNTFANKVIWITGASSGYGLALAKAFASAGAKVIISARNESRIQEIAAQLPQAKALVLDLAQTQQLKESVNNAVALYGHIDMVVHNAAIAQSASALETQLPVARQIMEVDYFAHTELTHWLLPHMMERKCGHIVAISGLLARLTLPGRSSYAAAKAALIAYFGCLRAELLAHNIDVTVLIPGAMQTELVSKALTADGSLTNTPTSGTGCPVDEAARQSLEAIAQKDYESYIGLQDDSFKLWQLTLNDANKGTQMLLDKLKGAK